ncbi:acyl-CoA-binding protein [Kroppenstedtia sanguinis]|uniref:hypothetical protein n=1 Tax=Kroppenstedtia sanguinis TaxID=1380684 RepID=UPI003D1EE0EC
MMKPRINVRAKDATITEPLNQKRETDRENRQTGGRDFRRRGEGGALLPEGRPPGWKRPLEWALREVEEGDPIGWGSPYSGRRPRKGGEDKRLRSILVAVSSAVLLGILMGGLILNLFFSEEPDLSTRSIDSHMRRGPVDAEESRAQESKAQVEEKKQASKKKSSAKSLQLPVLQAVLVQGGNFKEKAGALETVRKYRSEGWAAVTTEDPPYRIYHGVGLDREASRKLTEVLEKKDSKTYVKSVQLGKGAIPRSSIPDSHGKNLVTWLNHGHQVFQLLGKKTAEGLVSEKKEVSLEPVWSEVLQHYNRLVQTAPQLEKGIPAKAKPQLVQMVRGMDQVVQSGQTNPKQLESAMLWQMQEGLIRYALAYEKFVEALR